MEPSVAFAVIFSLSFYTASSLKCYVCTANNGTVCQKGDTHLRTVNCGLEDTTFFWFCLYKVLVHTNTSREIHSYSCERMGKLDHKILQEKYSFGCERRTSPAIFPSASKLPHCKPDDDQELKECRVCFTDLCAFVDYSAGLSVKPNLLTFTFVTVIIIKSICM